MPRESVSRVIHASAGAVFELIHDYDRRLQWDTLLRAAYLCDGARRAARGVESVCKGKWIVGGIPIRSVYVSFAPGERAAIKMVNSPPFFASFAATLEHEQLSDGNSRVTYIYSFHSKPAFLRPLIEPIMNILLRREVRSRLDALKRFMESKAEATG